MKKIVAVVVLVVVVLIGFFGLERVRTWSAVGKEALVDKIDMALGEYDVKRMEAADGIEGLGETLRVIREGQIKSEVKSEQLAGKLEAVRNRMDETQHSLETVREHLVSGQTLVLAGRAYDAPALNALAQKLIAAFDSLQAKETGIDKAKGLLEANAANLAAKAEQGQRAISDMKNQLETIDAKILALSTMRDAAQSSMSHGDDLAAAFTEVSDQLDNLYAKVETGLRLEETAWQDVHFSGEAEVEQVVNATQPQDVMVDRIDEILKR